MAGHVRQPRGVSALVRLAVVALVGATPVQAQERITERHTFDEPEGRLISFYSATMAFTPAGLATGAGLGFGVELTVVPRLNEAQRRPSIDKPESTNLAPLFPRPRVGARLGAFHVEASWIPPIRVFDVEANVVSASVTLPAWQRDGITVAPRLWGSTGRVRGTITCAEEEMVGKGSALESYYALVCHGNESDDWFEPRLLGGELVASRDVGPWLVYGVAGVRLDRTRFDIGVIKPDGTRDLDHPVLELEATRPHLALGASWQAATRLSSGMELFYAPGSVFTVRATARWSVRP